VGGALPTSIHPLLSGKGFGRRKGIVEDVSTMTSQLIGRAPSMIRSWAEHPASRLPLATAPTS